MIDNRLPPRHRPVIRVFVSSTFTDLKRERDALQREVFLPLEAHCASRQFQFQAIDLRWGVPTEASLDHRTMRICFEELRRSQEISPQPNFLVLLGSRYGWRPLPEEISIDEFQQLDRAAQTPEEREILGFWYQRDDNAIPPVHLLRTRKKELNQPTDYSTKESWEPIQTVLWDIINRAYPASGLTGRFASPVSLDEHLPSIVRFQASATEREVWRGALGAMNPEQHVLAFVREIENRGDRQEFPDAAELKEFVDVDGGVIDVVSQGALRDLKEELKRRLVGGHPIESATARLKWIENEKGERRVDVTTEHLAAMCRQILDALMAIIDRQMNEYWATEESETPPLRLLELERNEHHRFGLERAPADAFVGRERHLQAIHDYIKKESHGPLVVHGASGCGKTALLARAAQRESDHKPVVRFIGVTPHSSDIRTLLSSLCQELRQRNPRSDALPTEIKELRDEFSQHLQVATPQQPLILFLDALDQLADLDNGRLLNWLPPGSLPAHVKLVVSCLSDRATGDPAGQPYAELNRRQIPGENFINLDVLSEAEARLLLFDRWLLKAGRKVSDDQRARIEQRLASPDCRQPIFLKLLFEEVQLWHSYDPALLPGESVPALLGQLFDRLSQPTNHDPLLVNRVLGYLSASRHGLAENEILEILFADIEYRAKLNEAAEKTRHELPPNAQRIPIALWSRLRFDLAPYLTERAAPGANVLTFYHRQVAEAAIARYLDEGEEQGMHQRLADYFEHHKHQREMTLRKLTEWPYQLQSAQDWERLKACLLNPKALAPLIRQSVSEVAGYWRSLEVLTEPALAYRKAWNDWHNTVTTDEEMALTHGAVGDLLTFIGNNSEAENHLNAAIILRSRLRNGPYANPEPETLSVEAWVKLAKAQRTHAEYVKAERTILSAIAHARELVSQHPENATVFSVLAKCHQEAGMLYLDQLDTDRALRHSCVALETANSLAARMPGNEDAAVGTIRSQRLLGDVRSLRGEHKSALLQYTLALDIVENVQGWNEDTCLIAEAAMLHRGQGREDLALGDMSAAFNHCEAAVALWQQLRVRDPNSAEYRYQLCLTQQQRAGAMAGSQSNIRAALAQFETALATAQSLATLDPRNVLWHLCLAECLYGFAVAHRMAGDRQRSQRLLAEARRVLEEQTLKTSRSVDLSEAITRELARE